MQDVTKGQIKTFTGPTVINQTAQEVPVVYYPETGEFKRVGTLEEAVRKSAISVEGFYLILKNPAKKDERPSEGSQGHAPDLDIGRKINVPGPCMFALWPGQAAESVRGHHLRSNQYLLVRVYNEEEARKNWSKAIVKPATTVEGGAPPPVDLVATAKAPKDLTVGRLLIIKGTEVSFYIPPTGIGVVIGDDGQYVREALTLERLEYCILVGESGNKRYERGPQVVFPEPTERFTTKGQDRKFRALELNEIQGLHLKVIAPYVENGREYKVGDELFITGKETSIYFPREEHSLVSYDGKSKHFATAVPAGEARYVMDRMSGEIKMMPGPAMLLPDPRKEVIVRRVLSDKQVTLWYPGNNEALGYNQSLRALLANSPSTRAGAVSEGDAARGGLLSNAVQYNADLESKTIGSAQQQRNLTRSNVSKSAAAHAGHMADHSNVSSNAKLDGVDEFSRASSYNAPRSITIDTKYEGCPAIQLWTGYAIMVVSKTGKRRVEHGPKTVLLAYDESLEVIGLSTGKPKSTDQIYSTVYLRTLNNKVADIVEAETSDHVGVTVRISLRVNFTGEANKWFEVENYVKFLCDHVRSVVKGGVRKFTVEQFYADSTTIVRDLVLGKADDKGVRAGMMFEENGMHVDDVEVLAAQISDVSVAQLMNVAQLDVVKSNVQLNQARRALDVVKTTEQIEREKAEALVLTEKRKHQLQGEQAASRLALVLTQLGANLQEQAKQREVEASKQETLNLSHDAQRDRNKLDAEQELEISTNAQELRLEALKAEAEAVVIRFTAAQGGFSEALLTLSNNETLQKVAEAWNIQRAIGGDSLADALQKVFAGTPLATVMAKIIAPAANGSAKPNAQV
jgi:major vault protein